MCFLYGVVVSQLPSLGSLPLLEEFHIGMPLYSCSLVDYLGSLAFSGFG